MIMAALIADRSGLVIPKLLALTADLSWNGFDVRYLPAANISCERKILITRTYFAAPQKAAEIT
jgi:hypothetical protein